MSEFIVCDRCGELVSFELTDMVNKKIVCPACLKKKENKNYKK
ncbi:hypothetical protein AB1L05_10530 [Cytobacillus horneckiae]